MKKIISLTLWFILIFSLSVCSFAVEGEVFYDVIEFKTNPLYEGLVDAEPSEITEESGSKVLLSAPDPEYCETIEQAADSLRQQMEERNGAPVVYYVSATGYDEQFFEDIFNEALSHTGEPTEGDYLKWVWSGKGGTVSGFEKDGKAYITFDYSIEYYTNAQQEAELDAAVENLLVSLDLEGKTQYEKVRAIYDYICDNITYDYDNLKDKSYKLKYTAYAALINKTAVCQGYASLFYRLALAEGIDARLIAGLGDGGAHGWNIVRLAGKYYNLDSTWDAGSTEYSYFLKCEENFLEHERYDEYNTPAFNEEYPMSSTSYGFSGEENVYAGGWCGTEGFQGKNLEWELSAEGVLTISGEGKMNDYGDFEETYMADAPWKPYKNHISSLVMEKGMTSIGGCAFFEYPLIEDEIVIPETVTKIGVGAFAYCNGLSGELIIPENVTYIGHHAFFRAGIENISVSENSKSYSSFDGILYSKDMKTLLLCPSGKTGSIVVSDNVEKIEMQAFNGCFKLTGTLVLPEKLVYIGRMAFEDCSIDKYYFCGKTLSGIYANGENMPTFDSGDTIYYPENDDTWVVENGKWNGYNAVSWDVSFKIGDIDGDNDINIKDAYFARLVAAKLVVPTQEQLSLGDVDGDGRINAIDANIIRKFCANMIKKFPTEEQ